MASLLEGDCEWIAYDSAGQLGFFTSAGSSCVPTYYLDRIELHHDILEAVMNMPETCTFELAVPPVSGLSYESWTSIAEKGVYGYDYDLHDDSGYKLVTMPQRPIKVDANPGKIAAFIRDVPFFDGVFGVYAKLIGRQTILQLRTSIGEK